MHTKKNRAAFSLIEALIATLLVGIAIAALMAANTSLTQASGAGTELSTAEFLIEQIKERIMLLDYDNLLSLDGTTYNPPINAAGESLSDFASFSQEIVVENVSNTDFETVVADGTSDFIRVTITVYLNSRDITTASSIRADY